MSRSAQIQIWHPLAQSLAAELGRCDDLPLCVAISGAQGTGKTTLARMLVDELAAFDVGGMTCSLDDFYLDRASRVALSRTVHPLLRTRGVPGTHDVELCLRVFDEVTRRPTPIPVFDKGRDDRIERDNWPVVGPVAVVVIEGWCLGARPQSTEDLVAPINELERDEDADGRWRTYVNTALARYQDLFDRFDELVYLQAPDFDAVLRWRGEQELQIAAPNRMNSVELRRFTAHYERITRAMMRYMPAEADVTVVLDAAHAIETVVTHAPR
jgi:D-glycerate 3-kinase